MPLNDNAMHFSHSFVEGWIARLEQNEFKARAAFESARVEQEKIVQAQPSYAPSLCVLGVIDAALGRKQEGLSECRRAVELLPVEKDAFNGPLMIQWYAIKVSFLAYEIRTISVCRIGFRYFPISHQIASSAPAKKVICYMSAVLIEIRASLPRSQVVSYAL